MRLASGVLVGNDMIMIPEDMYDCESMDMEVAGDKYDQVSDLFVAARRGFAVVSIDHDFPATIRYDTAFRWAAGDTVYLVARDSVNIGLYPAAIRRYGNFGEPPFADTKYMRTNLDEFELPNDFDFMFNPIMAGDGRVVGVCISPYRVDSTIVFVSASEIVKFSADRYRPMLKPRAGSFNWWTSALALATNLSYRAMMTADIWFVPLVVLVSLIVAAFGLASNYRTERRMATGAASEGSTGRFQGRRARIGIWLLMAVLVSIGILSFRSNSRRAELKISESARELAGPLPTEEQWKMALNQFLEAESRTGLFMLLTGDECALKYDVVKTNGRWFFCIISKRKDTRAVSVACVGKLEGDEIYSVWLRTKNNRLQGEALQSYLRLSERDSLWSMYGKRGFWEEESALEAMYEECEKNGAMISILSLHP